MSLSYVLRGCVRRARGRARGLAFTTRSCRAISTSNVCSGTPDHQFYDVIISGGGMVGTAMACALGHSEIFQNRKILLLEASPEKSTYTLPETYSNRVCALSPGTKRLLASFGAWEAIEGMRVQNVKRMQVWEACSDSLITFDRDNMAEDLAHIVENDVILSGISGQLPPHVEVLYDTKLSDIEYPDQRKRDESPWVKVSVNHGQCLHCKLLIGADGSNSFVRKKSKIHVISWDYKQSAVVATLELTEAIDNNVAWQRFLPTGPIAILPLKENLSSLVWSTTPSDASNLLSLPEENFVDSINSVLFDNSLKDPLTVTAGNFMEQLWSAVIPGGTPGQQLPPTVVGLTKDSRAMFPLGLMHASHYIKPRMALIGDAAHRIHPLAGQGVNLGFGDVECLRYLLVTSLQNGGDIGSLLTLSQYETQRQRHVVPTMAAIDGLQRLYGTTLPPVVFLRSLGLQAVNAIAPFKDRLMQHAIK